MTLKKRRTILALCVLIFLLSTPPLLLYTLGYRWNPILGAYKTGGLYISSPVTGSKIFINNKEKKQTNIFQGSLFLQSLRPGKYSALVAKDGYWPWQKTLLIKEQFVTEARAMLVPKEPKGKIILWDNFSPLEFSKYDEILSNLKKIQLSSTTPRFTSNQKEKLWWNPKDNKVWVEWLGDRELLPYFFCDDKFCSDEILIFNSRSPVRNVNFYPKRKDAVIIAVQNGIYALEIDGRGGRNIQPIYKGKEPTFTTYKNESSIYILEEDKLIEIKME
jgi:hypothetical protein